MRAAAQIGGPAGDALRSAAENSFVDAFGIALLVGAGFAFAGAAVVLRFMPGQVRATVRDEAGQAAQEVEAVA